MLSSYNLIDEKWIPIIGKSKVSLKDIFQDDSLTYLDGDSVSKISVFKLLQAIAQSAYTPKDMDDYRKLGCKGMQEKVLKYLDKYHDCFYLYGDKPFLQVPKLVETKRYKADSNYLLMNVAKGNNSIVYTTQLSVSLTDSDKAMALVNQIGFGIRKNGQSDRPTKTGAFCPNDAGIFLGPLHSYLICNNLLNSIYMNIFPEDYIVGKDNMQFESIGTPPWISMPQSSDDKIAQELKNSYMGQLLPISMFVLLDKDDTIYLTEGVLYPSIEELQGNRIDPTVAIQNYTSTNKKGETTVNIARVMSNTTEKPWRQLTSILSFLNLNSLNSDKAYICKQLQFTMNSNKGNFTDKLLYFIWSGGVKISDNAGNMYFGAKDDFVESETNLSTEILNKEQCGIDFINNLGSMIEMMKDFCNRKDGLKSCITAYYKDMKFYKPSKYTGSAEEMYWQICESIFHKYINFLDGNNFISKYNEIKSLLNKNVIDLYNQSCPNANANQFMIWAKHMPKGVNGMNINFDYEQKQVDDSLREFNEDIEFKSAAKYASNPNFENRLWGYLVRMGVNLEYENDRLPYILVLSTMAKFSKKKDGTLGLGEAILQAFNSVDKFDSSSPASSRLRRIIACTDMNELYKILFPILNLICNRGVNISFGKLLYDLKYFNVNQEKTKARWAQDFFK